jgi:hypothetical protein
MRLRLAVVLLVAACGQGAGHDVLVPAAAPSTSASPIARADACPKQAGGHLPDQLGTVTRAYVCTSDVRAVPGDGEWQFDLVREVTGGLPELLKAYAAGDAAPTNGFCTLEAAAPLDVTLHADRVVTARAPHNSCGKPSAEARAAYDALALTEVEAVKVRQVQTEQSKASGCPDRYKDIMSVDEKYGGKGSTTGDPRPQKAPLLVCTYVVEVDPQGDRIGRLTATRTLAQPAVDEVNAALGQVTVDTTCSRHEHTRFVILGGGVEIALDGCGVQQDNDWWRGTEALRQAVS